MTNHWAILTTAMSIPMAITVTIAIIIANRWRYISFRLSNRIFLHFVWSILIVSYFLNQVLIVLSILANLANNQEC